MSYPVYYNEAQQQIPVLGYPANYLQSLMQPPTNQGNNTQPAQTNTTPTNNLYSYRRPLNWQNMQYNVSHADSSSPYYELQQSSPWITSQDPRPPAPPQQPSSGMNSVYNLFGINKGYK